MPGKFMSSDGDLETMFVDDYAMIDQFATTGSLWSWGKNSYGALGFGNYIDKSSPVQTYAAGTNWKQVECGDQWTTAIKTDGTLWSWGSSVYGQTGNNTINNKSSPTQTTPGGTNWKQVAAGRTGGTVAAIKTDGTLWMWGYNDYGQLGNNDANLYHKSTPVQTVSGGSNWRQVACGGGHGIPAYVNPSGHTAAIKTDGTLWMWGFNGYGQLGNNTLDPKSSPIQTITGGTNWKQVACGSTITAAIKTDGTLWTWGGSGAGQLGDNTLNSKSSPVQTITGGTNWKQVSCGGSSNGNNSGTMSAIKTDGTLWMWGNNFYGQLGDNTTDNKSSPVQTIAGGTNWKQVVCGDSATAAIKTDGTLWTWGGNNDGELGNNTLASKSSPIQTIAGGNNWKQVSQGSRHTAAIYFYDAGNLYPGA